MKDIGYFAQRSWLLFSPKEEATSAHSVVNKTYNFYYKIWMKTERLAGFELCFSCKCCISVNFPHVSLEIYAAIFGCFGGIRVGARAAYPQFLLPKSLFPMFVTAVAMSVKAKDHVEKKTMFTVLCWSLKARIVELSNVHLAATAHAPSPPVCEFYSHCNWLGKLLKKVFYDWIIPASSCWGGICTALLICFILKQYRQKYLPL